MQDYFLYKCDCTYVCYFKTTLCIIMSTWAVQISIIIFNVFFCLFGGKAFGMWQICDTGCYTYEYSFTTYPYVIHFMFTLNNLLNISFLFDNYSKKQQPQLRLVIPIRRQIVRIVVSNRRRQIMLVEHHSNNNNQVPEHNHSHQIINQ